jgi:hypothetical protein
MLVPDIHARSCLALKVSELKPMFPLFQVCSMLCGKYSVLTGINKRFQDRSDDVFMRHGPMRMRIHTNVLQSVTVASETR